MDHGGEVARPTKVVESTDLSMAGAVQGDEEANIGSAAFDGQLATAPGSFSDFHLSEAPVAAGFDFYLHRQPGHSGVAYPNIGEFSRQLGPVDVALLGLQQLPADDGVVVPVHGNYGYSALQARPGAGRGMVLADLLPDDADAAYNDYGYYAPEPRPGAGHGEVLVGLLADANEITGALGDPNLGAGYDNRGVVSEHLRRLLPFAGIGACSVAVNGLVAGPGSPAVAFDLFALFLGGLLMVILHVLHV